MPWQQFADVEGFVASEDLVWYIDVVGCVRDNFAVMRYGPDVGAANVPPRLCSLGSAIFTRTKSPTFDFECLELSVQVYVGKGA